MFNPFALFDIKEDFNVDIKLLNDKYFEFQKLYHPDNFVNEDNKTQLEMLQKSIDINQAYNVLKDNILRAQALLDIAKNEEHFEEGVIKDFEFIKKQFELRAKADSLKANYDFDLATQILDECDKLYKEELAGITEAFAQKDYQAAQTKVYRLQFIKKLESETTLVQ